VTRGWGQNARLTHVDIKRAILEYVQHRALAEGKNVPQDLLDFMERADVVFLDLHGNAVHFDLGVVTWDS
jgi:hypothetical protein